MNEQLIHEGSCFSLYRLPPDENGEILAVKVLNEELPQARDLARLHNEDTVLAGLDIPGVRRVRRTGKFRNRHALFFDYLEGVALIAYLTELAGDLTSFLRVAISAATTVGRIHRHKIIHRDLNPYNILVDPETCAATIIDFGLATRLKLQEYHLGNPDRLECTLAYASPEQTGRMNRSVDYRSDLYSLGATFYHALTGRRPFGDLESIELVHAHLAVQPVPVHLVEPSIPPTVSRIVERLLAKNAEDRYQSAGGLCHDLQRCLDYLSQGGVVPEMRLGERDAPLGFTLPQRLYGRKAETDTLLGAFRSAASGDLQVVWVAGASGTGKSTLVRRVHRPITAARGYYVEGKFDQFQRAVPYFALLRAFTQMVELMLTEGDSKLADLRARLLEAIGSEGRVLTDVLPQLELIVGPQPEVPQLPATEASNRFNYLMRKFVAAVATVDHPLVIFVDDLQWADSASLNLIRILATDPDPGHLLFVGAYRDNEVDDAHPLALAMGEIADFGTPTARIELDCLQKEDVRSFISDALLVDPADRVAAELCDLVMMKTRGNAFFINQFLYSLHEEELLRHDGSRGRWTADVEAIRRRDITDNVVELLTGRIRQLPVEVQEVLQLGACIGNTFTLQQLSLVHRLEPDAILRLLAPALEEGILIPSGDGAVKFSHDRIQQAAYSMISDRDRYANHYRIGRLLLERMDPEQVEHVLFDVVNQLNFGIDLIQGQAERTRLAALNLRAGNKARRNSAFETAAEYLATGIRLLPTQPWRDQYDLCLSLHREAVEMAYLCGDLDRMAHLFDLVLAHGRGILDRVKAYEIRIQAYIAENRLLDAIHVGLEVLAQLGEKFPTRATRAHTLVAFATISARLWGKSMDELAALPEMTRQDKIAAQRIITNISSSAYWAYPELLPLLVFRNVRLSLDYGNTAVSAFSFGSYGVILCGVAGSMRRGYEFGKLSQMLVDRFDAKEWQVYISVLRFSLINFWSDHVRETLPQLKASFQTGLETGAIEYACINTHAYCINSYMAGRPLKRVEEEARTFSESFRRLNQYTYYYYNEAYRQAMLNFMGRSDDVLTLTGAAYNEEEMLVQNEQRNDQTGKFFIHFNKLILGYHFGEYGMAYAHSVEARTLLLAILAKFEVGTLLFYEALNALAFAAEVPGRQAASLRRRARKNERELRKFARSSPGNYAHKYWLIRAERLGGAGRRERTRTAYEKAIELALANEYTQEAALAYERYALYLTRDTDSEVANYYLRRAYSLYREWGGEAKLQWLRREHGPSLSAIEAPTDPGSPVQNSAATLTTASLQDFDLEALLRATTTISGQMDLRSLLSVMMRIVVETAGADRAVLLLADEQGDLYQEAEHASGSDAVSEVLQHRPVSADVQLSRSVVQYVERTREVLLIPDVRTDSRFGNRAYFRRSEVRSLIGLPIRNQGKFLGILYLENRLAAGAFTRPRLQLLRLLAGQIAISIDNANLYRQLEMKVRERTAELAAEKARTDHLLLNILPQEIARELKVLGRTTPRRFNSVTVLFTDFVGFTSIAETVTPEQLVQDLDTCFRAFDEIVDEFGLEKIKTIGDSYMCVGGLPLPSEDHAPRCVRAAIAMRDWVRSFNHPHRRGNQPRFDVRIGIHSGSVVAGVVGSKKFAYDVWGDTVNTASRMESSGQPDRVNISGSTFRLIGQEFTCSHRGKIPAKNKGAVDMYFVERLPDPSLSNIQLDEQRLS